MILYIVNAVGKRKKRNIYTSKENHYRKMYETTIFTLYDRVYKQEYKYAVYEKREKKKMIVRREKRGKKMTCQNVITAGTNEIKYTKRAYKILVLL